MNTEQLIQYFSNLEERKIIGLLSSKLNSDELQNEQLINYELIKKDDENLSFLAHKFILQSIIDFAFVELLKFDNSLISINPQAEIKSVETVLQIKQYLKTDLIADLLELLHVNYLNSEFSYQNGKLKRIKSKSNLKESGSVYTQSEICDEITKTSIQNRVKQGTIPKDLKILDFGCATGRFYFSAIKVLNKEYSLPISAIIKNNLYGIDINEIAIAILKFRAVMEFGVEIFQSIDKNVICRNMLIPKVGFGYDFQKMVDYSKDFDTNKFDVIISNPPYFLLKINKNSSNDQNQNDNHKILTQKIDKELSFYRNSGIYNYSTEGMINYYKLSIEIMLQISKPQGEIGIICPSTIFGDVSSTKLRKYIINNNQLRQISFYPENAKLFDNVSQATSIFYISKNGKTDEILLNINDSKFSITAGLVKETFKENYEVPQMDEIGWDILKKISKFKKIKDFKNLRNKRGEFDLTLYKNFITNSQTGWRLVRGNMIDKEQINYHKSNENVLIDDFIKSKSDDFKKYDFKKVRLVCQQISNIDTAKRIKFVFSSETDILGNSCNYISSLNTADLKPLSVILNSQIINWRFKITSTNNHINNYELDELPLLDFTNFQNDRINGNDLINNIEISKMYGLNQHEIVYLLKDFYKEEKVLAHL